jgi:hypothetical protein|tara:strand:- start:3454 stop:3837 length:384 start_codon:yes stop_codon:yes gene_type:complete
MTHNQKENIMKIACTAFVLMLVASYGCATDDLVVGPAQLGDVVEDTVTEGPLDTSSPDVSAPDDSSPAGEEETTTDVTSSEDGNGLGRADVLLIVEGDIMEVGLDSDPTSFFSPAFRYVPSSPFQGR